MRQNISMDTHECDDDILSSPPTTKSILSLNFQEYTKMKSSNLKYYGFNFSFIYYCQHHYYGFLSKIYDYLRIPKIPMILFDKGFFSNIHNTQKSILSASNNIIKTISDKVSYHTLKKWTYFQSVNIPGEFLDAYRDRYLGNNISDIEKLLFLHYNNLLLFVYTSVSVSATTVSTVGAPVTVGSATVVVSTVGTAAGRTFAWTKDGGSTIGSNATLDVSAAGTYKVTISDASCSRAE